MRLRRAESGEERAILELHARTVRAVNSEDYTPEQIDAWLGKQRADKVRKLIEAGELYVCVDERNRLMGFGSRSGDRITGLYVAPEWLRHGAGSMLLEQLERDAIAEGIEQLRLNSTMTAVPFYRHHGYEWIEETTCFVVGEQALPAIAMRKSLT